MRDGWRALYCILKYNLHKAPWPIQFLFYIFIGGVSAIANLILFVLLIHTQVRVEIAAPSAFLAAAAVNYWLSVLILFRHRARWSSAVEILIFLMMVATLGYFDLVSTRFFIQNEMAPWLAKSVATALGLILNFSARRFIVFPEAASPEWQPQEPPKRRGHLDH